MNGNCCGARTRLSARIVTTAGATRLMTSAYEFWGRESGIGSLAVLGASGEAFPRHPIEKTTDSSATSNAIMNFAPTPRVLGSEMLSLKIMTPLKTSMNELFYDKEILLL